jgi:hypothetical protein
MGHWRSEELYKQLYRSRLEMYDLEKSQVNFMKDIEHVFNSSVGVNFTQRKDGDARIHLLNRFKLMYLSYHRLKRDAHGMSHEELGTRVDQLSSILDFSLYRVDLPHKKVMCVLQACQAQLDALAQRILYYDDDDVQSIIKPVKSRKNVEKQERKDARSRHVHAMIREVTEDLNDVKLEHATSTEYFNDTQNMYNEMESQNDAVQRELIDISQEIETREQKLQMLRMRQHELTEQSKNYTKQKTSLQKEMNMWAFSAQSLVDERRVLEDRIREFRLR